jgi:hypothetical protein
LALQRAGFDHWAHHYAERAVELLPSELWLRERLADTGFGWNGPFDEELLADSGASAWTQALLANAAMWEARRDDLARLIADPILAETDDVRAQVIYAYGVALVRGFDAARDRLTKLRLVQYRCAGSRLGPFGPAEFVQGARRTCRLRP